MDVSVLGQIIEVIAAIGGLIALVLCIGLPMLLVYKGVSNGVYYVGKWRRTRSRERTQYGRVLSRKERKEKQAEWAALQASRRPITTFGDFISAVESGRLKGFTITYDGKTIASSAETESEK